MKRKDKQLNPDQKRKTPAPKLVCGAPLDNGGTCQQGVPGDQHCRQHGGPSGFPTDALPEGVRIHKSFADEDKQAMLEQYVASILDEYQLNENADLRQIILSGIAYVRLVYEGHKMEPRDMDNLSKVVDRHLRNLRATPKEQAEKTSGKTDPGSLIGGVALGALLERVRGALTPGQLAQVSKGNQPRISKEVLDTSQEVQEVQPVQDQEDFGSVPPGPDPFGDL